MTEHMDRYWADEEESQADTPQLDDLEAVEEDELLGDATGSSDEPPSGRN